MLKIQIEGIQVLANAAGNIPPGPVPVGLHGHIRFAGKRVGPAGEQVLAIERSFIASGRLYFPAVEVPLHRDDFPVFWQPLGAKATLSETPVIAGPGSAGRTRSSTGPRYPR